MVEILDSYLSMLHESADLGARILAANKRRSDKDYVKGSYVKCVEKKRLLMKDPAFFKKLGSNKEKLKQYIHWWFRACNCDAETADWKVGLGYLNSMLPKCGGDQKCIAKVQEQISKYREWLRPDPNSWCAEARGIVRRFEWWWKEVYLSVERDREEGE